jgi:hypothetical protein
MKRAAILRKSELRSRSRPKTWRRKPEDRESEADVNYVKVRDGCVARTLGAPTKCTDNWGNPFDPRQRPDLLEADHIRPAPMMGNRGPGGTRWMAGMCPFHHRLENPPWAVTHRADIRAYLARIHGEEPVE